MNLIKQILLFSLLAGLFLTVSAQKAPVYIMVDQFGYLPKSKKIAVLADPQKGFNADDSYTPSKELILVNEKTGKTVYKSSPVIWKDGAIDNQAGDRGWWFDFSSISDTGSYYILDKKNKVRSYSFRIANNVYWPVFKAACRMFFYNRCNFAKQEPYADKRWTDSVDFMKQGQDRECADLNDRTNPKKMKDLSGGWWDAGDPNKYITFLYDVMHPLISALNYNVTAFKDNLNIPESGNGIPDIVDEMLVELRWMIKMQENDGGVHIKMGEIEKSTQNKPSQSNQKRYYDPVCSSSTIVASGIFAHAALMLKPFPLHEKLRNELILRAEMAWRWYHSHPKCDTCDNQIIRAGDADISKDKQATAAIVAAIYLYKATKNNLYNSYLEIKLPKNEILKKDNSDLYNTTLNTALLEYSVMSDADSLMAVDIINRQKENISDLGQLYGWNDSLSLYWAYTVNDSYHWGSVMPIASTGIITQMKINFDIEHSKNKEFYHKAEGILHYFHGVNPLNLTYLSNMYELGGDNCVNQLYHFWFKDGSQWDDCRTSSGPPPGYVSGGPNAYYKNKDISPPFGQPLMKSYKDWNVGGTEKAWEISEPAIYYQALYIRLLAPFVNILESMNTGIVLKSTGSWYKVKCGDTIIDCRISGKMREDGIRSTNPVAVGDSVQFEPESESQGVIKSVNERKNYIIRRSSNLSKESHIVASNIDNTFLMVSLRQPRTHIQFIDRFLVSAEAYRIPVTIVFNKTDIYSEKNLQEMDSLCELYSQIGYRCISISVTQQKNLQLITGLLKDKISLFSGNSGVGKSSLINALYPTLSLRTASVSKSHNKGMHTTTFAEMFELPDGGFIIDTPGLKGFGLHNMQPEEISHYFPEMFNLLDKCEFYNCTHIHEPGCEVLKALSDGRMQMSRYENYVSMILDCKEEKYRR